MRITNSMLITNMLSNLNNNLNTMSRKQDELATGKKVIFASDNPVAAAKILKFKTDLADMNQYAINTRDAQAILDASESSIAEMGNVLQRARELAVQAANGTYTVLDTKKIKEEITQLRDHLITSGNSNFAGKYQFSSFYTDRALLTTDGKYNIPITADDVANKPVSIYEVSPKESIPVGTHGIEIFGSVLDSSAYSTQMPNDTNVKGVAAQMPAIRVDIDLVTVDYTAETLAVNVNGAAYNVTTTALINPVDKEKFINQVKNALNGTTKLSDVANVYFDMNEKLVIQSKTAGSAGTLSLTTTGGLSNAYNISTPNAPVALGAVTDVVTGVDAAKATVTGTGAATPAADYYGKSFVMTYNGLTKEIRFPTSGTVAALEAGIQTEIDTAFGAGKVVAKLSPTISFESVTNTTDLTQPSLRVQQVVTTQPELIKDFNDFIGFLDQGPSPDVSNMIGKIDKHLQQLLAVRADLGARNSRLELVDARIAENNITFTRLLSDSQDADMSEVIMYLKNAENVYKSALSVGGRIIQPSLVDFIR